MRVLFVANAPAEEVRAGNIRMASLRYRASMPVAELLRTGFDARLEHVGAILAPEYEADADCIVLAQPKENILLAPNFLAGFLAFIQRSRAAGRRIALDVCDLKIGEPYLHYIETLHGADVAAVCRQFYPAILRAADLVVTPTDALALRLRQWIGGGAFAVVPDPVEVQTRPVRFDPAPGRPLRLLWFGYFGSHAAPVGQFCRTVLPQLAQGRDVSLLLLAEEQAEGPIQRLMPEAAPALLQYQPWSLPALDAALAECDAAVMPLDYETESAVGKSNNRALQALYAGRPVFAHPIASYLELSAYGFIGPDLLAGLRAALADPETCRRRTEAGQRYVAETYGIAAIGSRWAKILGALSR